MAKREGLPAKGVKLPHLPYVYSPLATLAVQMVYDVWGSGVPERNPMRSHEDDLVADAAQESMEFALADLSDDDLRALCEKKKIDASVDELRVREIMLDRLMDAYGMGDLLPHEVGRACGCEDCRADMKGER